MVASWNDERMVQDDRWKIQDDDSDAVPPSDNTDNERMVPPKTAAEMKAI